MIRSPTHGRPWSSDIVESMPSGLFSARCTRSSRSTTGSPSTCTTAVSGSTRRPISRTTLPSTLTRPAAMSSSAARRDATPAWASTFCSRTPSGLSSVVHCPLPVFRPASIASMASTSGSRGASGGRSSIDVRPSRSRNSSVVRNSVALRRAVHARLLDEPSRHQGTQHAVAVHTADRRDAGTGHRLAVGDHGEGLQRRPGELRALAAEQQPLDERGVGVAGVEPPAVPHPAQVDPAAVGSAWRARSRGQRGADRGRRGWSSASASGVVLGGGVDDEQQRLQRGLEPGVVGQVGQTVLDRRARQSSSPAAFSSGDPVPRPRRGPPDRQLAEALRLVERDRRLAEQLQHGHEPGDHLQRARAVGGQRRERRLAQLGQPLPQDRDVLGDARRSARAGGRRRPSAAAWAAARRRRGRRTAPGRRRAAPRAAARRTAPPARPSAGSGAAPWPPARRTAARPACRRGTAAAGRTAGRGPPAAPSSPSSMSPRRRAAAARP